MPRLSLSLLGPKQILLEGMPVRAFTYNKAIALLAYLAVEAGVAHSRQTLVGLLWPDLPNAAALTNLRQVLADLRQIIADATASSGGVADESASHPFLLITRESIQLNVDSDFQLDTTTFLDLLSSCESHRHRHMDRCRICQARLEVAIELYRGDFLSGFSVEGAAPFEDWLSLRREEFHQRGQQILVYLVNYHLRSRNDDRAQRYLRRQVEFEPWREEAHQQLMRLYARNGQRATAFLQFDSCQRILAAELGVEPAPLTQDLYAQIRDGLPLAEEVNARQLRYWHNLPLATTSLVGRSKELEQLGDLLADPTQRLITILGPGGIGKTRLALAAAAENAVAFANGVLFVSLAGVSDVHFLPNAIISALETPLSNERSPQEQLLLFLRDLELLLLLDNYEQFLPDVEFLTQLLRLAPGVTILVTSRERLAMQAEHLLELAGLDLPRTKASEVSNATLDQYSALQLFVQRVRQVQRDFAATPADVAAILRIGRVTEGMPLALELAAAAVRFHSCAEIASALESGQQVLSTQMRDLPERQRSMQAVFAHSMRLLSAEEHRAFCALALFRGGCTAGAAEDVAHAPLEMLIALVDKSLLRTTQNYRYDMHELIRQHAEKELEASSASAEVRQRYQMYFRAYAKAANDSLEGTQAGIWIARLEQEIDNLRAVLDQLRLDAPEEALRMALDLFWLWQSRSYLQEGLDWLTALSSPDAPVSPSLRANAYRAAAFFEIHIGEVEQAQVLVTKSLTICQNLDLTDWQNTEGLVHALSTRSYVFLFQGDYEQAVAVSLEALAIAQSVSFKNLSLTALFSAAEAYSTQERYDQAQTSYEECLRLACEIGDVRANGRTTARLANIAVALGYVEQARMLSRQALTICAACQDQVGLTWALLVMVNLANMESHYQRAAVLLGAFKQIAESNPTGRASPQDRRSYNAALTTLHAHLDASVFEQQWAKGSVLSLEESVTLALSNQE